MKISLIIILALFTVSSCKFSYDKAKVEESYGGYEGGGDSGGGGGDSGGGGGGSPTCDPDPAQSTITPDPVAVADGGITPFNITLTINDCNGSPFTADPADPVPEIQWLENSVSTTVTCSPIVAGTSTCAVTSSFAEDKTFQVISPSILNSMQTSPVTFTKPPLNLNLTACLGSAYDISTPGKIMSTPVIFNSNRPLYSPYVGSAWYTNSESAVFYSSTNFGTVIDWILVQIYSDEVSSVALTAKSAVIHDDGSITEPGALPGTGLSFTTGLSNNYNDSYKINIVHRNHLSIGLNDPVTRSLTTLDLTSPTTLFKDETGSITSDPYLIKGTRKCLRPGDFNNDFIVDVNDINDMRLHIFNLTSVDPFSTTMNISGYHSTDANFNGYSLLYLAPGTETQDTSIIRDQIDNFTMSSSFPIWNSGI